MINVLKNDFCRMKPRLVAVLIMLTVTVISIFFAVFITGVQQVKGHIAVVTDHNIPNIETSQLRIDTVSTAPLHSALVRQEYDAIATINADGTYHIETLRNDDFKNMVEVLLENPQATVPASKEDRSTGVNVVGFLMIFLGMSSFFYFFPFAEDKEQGQLLRISASPVSFNRYLAAHLLFCLCSFLPPWIMLVILQAAGWNIGFTIGQYAFLFLILAVLGSSFALLMHTFIKKPDNANMLGNSLMIVTSTLAGCFYSFSKENAILDHVINLIPQKQFMNFAIDLQNGEVLQHLFPMLYIIVISLLMFAVAYLKLKHDYAERV